MLPLALTKIALSLNSTIWLSSKYLNMPHSAITGHWVSRYWALNSSLCCMHIIHWFYCLILGNLDQNWWIYHWIERNIKTLYQLGEIHFLPLRGSVSFDIHSQWSFSFETESVKYLGFSVLREICSPPHVNINLILKQPSQDLNRPL